MPSKPKGLQRSFPEVHNRAMRNVSRCVKCPPRLSGLRVIICLGTPEMARPGLVSDTSFNSARPQIADEAASGRNVSCRPLARVHVKRAAAIPRPCKARMKHRSGEDAGRLCCSKAAPPNLVNSMLTDSVKINHRICVILYLFWARIGNFTSEMPTP